MGRLDSDSGYELQVHSLYDQRNMRENEPMAAKLKYLIAVWLCAVTCYGDNVRTDITRTLGADGYYRDSVTFSLGADGYYRGSYGGAAPVEPFVYWTNPVPYRLWWAGGTNATGADDVSANALDGIMVGAVQEVVGTNSDGQVKYGFRFDGVDDRITNAFAFLYNSVTAKKYTNYTVSVTFRSERGGLDAAVAGVLSCRGLGANIDEASLGGSAASVGGPYCPYANNGSVSATNLYPVQSNAWQNITFMRQDAGNVKFYTNGVYVSTKALAHAMSGTTFSNLCVGARSEDSWNLKGLITDVIVYCETNLTDAQVSTYWSNAVPTNSHLALP